MSFSPDDDPEFKIELDDLVLHAKPVEITPEALERYDEMRLKLIAEGWAPHFAAHFARINVLGDCRCAGW